VKPVLKVKNCRWNFSGAIRDEAFTGEERCAVREKQSDAARDRPQTAQKLDELGGIHFIRCYERFCGKLQSI